MLELLAQATDLPLDPVAQPANGWVIFALFLMILILPQIIGYFLAKWAKTPELTDRMSAVTMAMIAALTPILYQLVAYYPEKTVGGLFRLGVDLDGGTNLVYEIKSGERENIEKSGKSFDQVMSNLVGAISRRANPSGAEDITVRRVGQDRVEVIVPGKDQAYVDELKERISTAGTLEFEILATEIHSEHRSLIRRARALPKDQDTVYDEITVQNPVTKNSEKRQVPVARWVKPAPDTQIGVGGGETLPAVSRNVTRDEVEVQQWLLALTPEGYRVTGDLLLRANQQFDGRTGEPSVGFTFNERGGFLFLQLTTKYKPLRDASKFRLAVIINGEIQSAPQLLQPIGGQGQITGRFTSKEVQKLVDILNAGALDIPLNKTPVSEFTISPLLGLDVRTKGLTACVLSAVVIFVFMLVYYRASGLIANISLVVNMLLTIAIMLFVQASFTLPGLAGLALTLGMAVDANVLIYERMREEIQRGASVKMAIHNGFDKAFSAIFDSNLTTIIASVILYMVGTDQVKGFAVTLFLGIVTSMFSALYFGRLVFELLERKRILKKLNMMDSFKVPSVDFLGKKKIAIAASLATLVVASGIAIGRSDQIFDIDFQGGTMVTFQFNTPKASEEIRPNLQEVFGNSLTLERLTVIGNESSDEKSIRWRLRVTNDDPEAVKAGLIKSLDSHGLRKITVKSGELVEIAAPAKPEGEKPADAKPEDPFAGGHTVTLTFNEKVTDTTARQAVLEQFQNDAMKVKYAKPRSLVQIVGIKKESTGNDNKNLFDSFSLKVQKDVTKSDLNEILEGMEKKLSSSVLLEELTNFSSAVGEETQKQAVLAIGLSLVSILLYIWFRFDSWSYGIGAIIALFHDVAIAALALPVAGALSGTVIGTIFGFDDFKVNLPVIAALLTIVGFSINDTIVIFDRVREVRGKSPELTTEMVNLSLNQTLSRTLLTSLTTGMTTLVLYIVGGESIHGFTFCMLIGFISGVYSTIYIASPVMLWVIDIERAMIARAAAKKLADSKGRAVVAKK